MSIVPGLSSAIITVYLLHVDVCGCVDHMYGLMQPAAIGLMLMQAAFVSWQPLCVIACLLMHLYVCLSTTLDSPMPADYTLQILSRQQLMEVH